MPSRLVLQALCHAVDRGIGGGCDNIDLTLGEQGRARVHYDAGMPLCTSRHRDVPAAHVLLTALWACRAKKDHLRVGETLCKMGLAVLNALCSTLVVTTVSEGQRCDLSYQRGDLVAPPDLAPTSEKDQTTIELALDAELLEGNVEIERAAIEADLREWRRELPDLPTIEIR